MQVTDEAKYSKEITTKHQVKLKVKGKEKKGSLLSILVICIHKEYFLFRLGCGFLFSLYSVN